MQDFCTNSYLYDPATLAVIEDTRVLVVRELERHVGNTSTYLGRNQIEVGLRAFVNGQGDTLGCYYICDKPSEEVYWLSDVPAAFFCGVSGPIRIEGKQHLRKITSQLSPVEQFDKRVIRLGS